MSTLINGKVKAAIAFLVSVSVIVGALVALDVKPRFWAWAQDVKQISDSHYSFLIEVESKILRGISLDIDHCLVTQDCPKATVDRLIDQEQGSIAEIERLKMEAADIK